MLIGLPAQVDEFLGDGGEVPGLLRPGADEVGIAQLRGWFCR
jgi:hypothetical protein